MFIFKLFPISHFRVKHQSLWNEMFNQYGESLSPLLNLPFLKHELLLFSAALFLQFYLALFFPHLNQNDQVFSFTY